MVGDEKFGFIIGLLAPLLPPNCPLMLPPTYRVAGEAKSDWRAKNVSTRHSGLPVESAPIIPFSHMTPLSPQQEFELAGECAVCISLKDGAGGGVVIAGAPFFYHPGAFPCHNATSRPPWSFPLRI
ncbi:hypothetical protein AABB87_14110 [Roseateles sp. PN1]